MVHKHTLALGGSYLYAEALPQALVRAPFALVLFFVPGITWLFTTFTSNRIMHTA